MTKQKERRENTFDCEDLIVFTGLFSVINNFVLSKRSTVSHESIIEY